MKRFLLLILSFSIVVAGFLLIKCGDLPSDPSKEPNNVNAELSVMNLASGVFQGDSTTIKIVVRYPDLTKMIKISFDLTIPDDTIYCKTGIGAYSDTLYVTRAFSVTGTKKVLIDVELLNGEVKSFYCTFNVIEKKLSVAFDTVPKSHRVITGFSDTMIFFASTNPSGNGIEFSVSSQPPLDTAKLKIVDLGLNAKVIATAPIDTIYRIAVIAQSGTARDTAFTELISCTKPVLNEVSSITTISPGKSDTLAFTLHVKAIDTVNMIKLLNTTSFVSGEITPIATNKDLLSFVFTPSEIKTYTFSIETTVNNVKDTMSYTISVVKASFQPWKQDTVTLNLMEGVVLNLSLVPYMTDTTLANMQLRANKGTVNGKVLSYIIPNGGIAKDSIAVTITKNSVDSSKIKFYININKSDTLKFTVAYLGNANTIGTAPVDTNKYSTGVLVTVAAAGTLAKAGYTFTGWNTVATGSGTARAAGTTFTKGAANDTFYAQWTTNPTFAVTYNGNGNTAGIVPVDANNYQTGASVTVGAAGTLAKEGYTFTGWNTVAAGSGTARAAGSVFSKGATNDTLFAQWTTNPTFTVTYNGNGNTAGIVAVDANNYQTGASVTVAAAGTLAKTGYTFAGWNTVAAGSGTARSAGSLFSKSATNDTLYAQWTTNPTFTVTYNGNGNSSGIVPVDANNYVTGASVTVADAGTLAKAGYKFTGWNTVAAGSGTARAFGTVFSKGAANDTLYAQWSTNPTFAVTYNGNGNTGGIGPVDANRYETGATVTVASAGSLFKTGYTFTGWNTVATGGGTTRAVESIFSKGATNDTLYAQWTVNPTFSVTYNGNGSTSGIAPVDANKYETGASVTVAAAGTLAKEGYIFSGWNTVATGSGTVHPGATTYTIGAANDTLYAQWTIVTYSINYTLNDGTNNAANPTTYTIETPTITLNAPVRAWYSFVGWYSTVDFSGIAVARITKGNLGNIILYAKFKMNVPVITTSPTNRNCPVNDSVTFTVIATGINLTYQWYKNGREIAGATAASYLTRALTVNDLEAAPVYFCFVSNTAGNVTSASATLTVSTLTDIEGNLYHQVKIGSQIWTMENLRVTKYNDGTAIPKDTTTEIWSATTPKYCFYNSTSNADSIKMFGALYNWHVVSPTNTNKLAPDGWHVPTDEEWTALSDYIGGSSVAGGKLKETGTAHWASPNTGATNETGFSAIPGGYRYGNGGFYDIGLYSAWWSATEGVATQALYLRAHYDSADLSSIAYFKSCGFAVRLLKD